MVKWPILSRTSTEQSGKNKKSGFFLLGLKYTLRTCFESKNFLPKSCPELSNQVHTQFFSLSNLLVVSKACATIRFQFFFTIIYLVKCLKI